MSRADDRRRAAFLAAAHEIESSRVKFPNRKERIAMQAAEMRARRIIEACSGKTVPFHIEKLIKRFIPDAQ